MRNGDILVFLSNMSAGRIEQAMARINAAMDRIDAARVNLDSAKPSEPDNSSNDPAGSARVMTLINEHEKLREEVAETIGQIDSLIEGLEA